ncbi:MAG: BTAD domain-containing putative transcriptional regulator [Actinomycetota bacterium]
MTRPALRFGILGPLEVMSGDAPVRVDAPKQRALLAVLVLHANEVVSSDRLLDLVWGDGSADGGVSKLRFQVSKLRDALNPGRDGDGSSVVVTRSRGYVLETAPDAVDAVRLERLVSDARGFLSSDPDEALGLFDEALALWRGPVLGEFEYEEWAQPEIRRLAELHLGAIEDRSDALLALGRGSEAVGDLQALVEEHPRRERLRGALMLALYRSGRQADALAAYQDLRRELGEGLGIDPSIELQNLEERILLQDPTLTGAGSVTEDRLRGYVLSGQIGEGAHGVVYRAAQSGVGREVAIKTIRAELANNAGFVRRFEAEAQLVASLEHPHIVSLFDFWRDPEGAYLVMPYLSGGNLADALPSGPMEPDSVATLVDRLGDALGYAHRRGVVHRDVTPENVLLDEEGNPYLADFGVAAMMGDVVAADVSSPGYLPPEVHAGGAVSAASDVFSLGVLAFAALTGTTPGPTGALPPVSSVVDGMPLGVDDVVARATAVDAADRYQEIGDFVDDLGRVLIGGEAPVGVAVEVRNPFKGLRAFGEPDAVDFFGRAGLIGELVETVGRRRLVGVVGPSGCGKSSLVRAGLVPRIRGGALPGSERWLITDVYPGSRPFAELEAALLRVAVNRPDGLVDALVSGGEGWRDVADQLLPDGSEVLLIVDQFEELFTLTPDEGVRRRFIAALTELSSDPLNRVRVVVTMRADFYDRPLEYSAFGDLLRSGLVSVTTPDEDSLVETVVGPASGVGLSVETGLAEMIAADVAGQPGGLPLMEYALTELFARRSGGLLTGEAYRRTGGVLGALGWRAEDLYTGSNDASKSAIRQVFLRLVAVEEGAADTRRRIPATELATIGVEADTLEQVLHDYGSHRLLTFDRDPNTRAPTIEVAHEALLSRWERLKIWIDERRDDLVLHRHLATAVAEWEENERTDAYLLGFGRLDHYEAFAAETDLALTDDERGYLAQSREHLDAERRRRRHSRRWILSGFAAAALIAIVLAVAALANQRRAEDASEVAQHSEQVAIEEAVRADTAAAEARQQAARSRVLDLSGASQIALDEDPELSILLALEAAGTEVEDGPLAQNVSALHESVLASRVLYQLPGSSQMATDAAGTLIVGAVGDGEPITVWDLGTGDVVVELPVLANTGTDAKATPVAMSRDGRLVATPPQLGDGVAVWDVTTGAPLFEIRGDHPGSLGTPAAYRYTFNADGSLLASRSWDHAIRVFDVEGGSLVFDLPLLPDDWAWGGGLAFNEDSTQIAASFAFETRVWDVATGELLHTLGDGWTGMSGVAFLPDGDLAVAYWAADPTIAVWDLATGSERLIGRGEGLFPRAIAVSDAGDEIVTANDEGKITVWQLTPNDLTAVRTTGGHTAGVGGLSIVEGDRVVTGSDDGTIRVWDNSMLGRGEGATALSDPWLFSDIAYGPSGDRLASGTITDFWISGAETGEQLVKIDLLSAFLSDLDAGAVANMAVGKAEFLNDGTTIAVSVWDLAQANGALGMWDAGDGSLVRRFTLNGEPLASTRWLDMNPDESLIAGVVGQDIHVWDTDTGEHVLTIPTRSNVWWMSVAFDPTGSRIAAQGRNQGFETVPTIVEVYDLDGNKLWAGSEHLEFVSGGIEYNPDGRHLLTSGLDQAGSGVAVVWDAANGEVVTRIAGFGGEVMRAVYSPDGGFIATGEISIIRLWDTDGHREVWALNGHPGGYVNSLAFSPDGTRLISAADIDGLVRTWYLAFDDLVDLAERRLTRDFTESECALYEIQPCPAGS